MKTKIKIIQQNGDNCAGDVQDNYSVSQATWLLHKFCTTTIDLKCHLPTMLGSLPLSGGETEEWRYGDD